MKSNVFALPIPVDVKKRLEERLSLKILEHDLNKMFRHDEVPVERQKAKPHLRRSQVFPKSRSYRYLDGGTDRRGNKIWFCWSCHRNLGGYFATWREVRSPTSLIAKRYDWSFRRIRKNATKLAEARRGKWKAKHQA